MSVQNCLIKVMTTAACAASLVLGSTALGTITLDPIGTYDSGIFDEGAAEIAAHDPASQRLFVSNADANRLDVLDISDPATPTLVLMVDLDPYGDRVNSVAVKGGLVAVAVQADPKQDPGSVVFFDTSGALLNQVTVGALPDMLTFTPDGSKVVVANEGEPDDDYAVDPQGSVSIIDVSSGAVAATVVTASFASFDGSEAAARKAGIRIYGPGASFSQDVEPEYIAISSDSKSAYVTLQENNALAVVDLDSAEVTRITSFLYKNHRAKRNALDASNKDDAINIRTWPVWGMYMPDGIAAYEVDGATFLVTANEGDARDYDGFSEEARVKDLTLRSNLLQANPELQAKANLGRLKTTTEAPRGMTMKDGENTYANIFSYGARSFSIWNEAGELVYDSGSDFEQITAAAIPDNFNASNDDNEFDDRSDDKGPEPEGVALAEIGGHTYAFIGLERVGGIMVYDITDVEAVEFVEYVNNRDFDEDPEDGAAGDLGPEGLLFIPAADSPTGIPLLVVAHEISGTTTIYSITVVGGEDD